MYLINTTTLELRPFLGKLPHYVILSHTWGDDEVTFENMQRPSTLEKASRGYQKIEQCCKQAKKDGYKWAWVDTCCIDKRSSAELSEAINSMYRYYWEADKCYAYLSDICIKHGPTSTRYISKCTATERLRVPAENSPKTADRVTDPSEVLLSPRSPEDIEGLLKSSRWFERGWTLQELLAPAAVEFYDIHWTLLGTKSSLATKLSRITDINVSHLRDRSSIKTASLGLRLSWASKRQTTRDEDIAYCLLGLVGVNMPLLYGEGKRAFRRLQVELLKQTRDHTMFLWSNKEGPQERFSTKPSFLAPSPELFHTADLVDIRPKFFQLLGENSVLEMTALGLHITLPCIPGWEPGYIFAVLDCSKEENTRIGIALAEGDDGRYRRSPYATPQILSRQQIKQAVKKELYILDQALKEGYTIGCASCAFKIDSLKMEGMSRYDVRGYMIDERIVSHNIIKNVRQSMTEARFFCNKIVKLFRSEAVVFTIKLRYANIAVLCGNFDGHSWLRVVLGDGELTEEEATELASELHQGFPSEHLRDSVTVSRGTELRVDVRARRSLLDRDDDGLPCWQLAIHIRAGSAMPLR